MDAIMNNGLGAGLGVNGSISGQFLSDRFKVKFRTVIMDTREKGQD